MAYENVVGVATRTIFITNLIAFCVANASFVDEGTTVDGTDTIYHMSRTTESITIYWNFTLSELTVSSVDEYNIDMKMSYSKITSYDDLTDTGSAGDRQYYRTEMTFNLNDGPYVQTHMFTDGKAVHSVVELYDDVFTIMSLGVADKYGTWEGGEYLQASVAYRLSAEYAYDWDFRGTIVFDGGSSTTSVNTRACYVRHIPDSQLTSEYDFARTGNTTHLDQESRFVVGPSTDNIMQTLVEDCSPSTYNERAPLFPVYGRVLDNDTSRWIMKMSVPYVRTLNISSLTPGVLVENDWMVFPVIQKSDGDTSLAPLSDDWGLAFYKDE